MVSAEAKGRGRDTGTDRKKEDDGLGDEHLQRPYERLAHDLGKRPLEALLTRHVAFVARLLAQSDGPPAEEDDAVRLRQDEGGDDSSRTGDAEQEILWPAREAMSVGVATYFQAITTHIICPPALGAH